MGTQSMRSSNLSLTQDSEGVYHTEHDMSNDGLDVTITEALAEIGVIGPVALIDDFSDHVDPDALNCLFRLRPNGEHRDLDGSLLLGIQGADVTVYADGEIEIRV